MQNDLFNLDISDTSLINSSNRFSKQIRTRNFQISPKYRSLEMVDDYFIDYDSFRIKNHIKKLLREPRNYIEIGNAGSDNLFLLEALGLGNNAKSFTVIINFSNCLDYVLHFAFGCPLSSIRRIENYERYSKSLLNMDFSDTNGLLLGDLINSNELILTYLNSLYLEAGRLDMNLDEVTVWVASKFYTRVLEALQDIKCRVAVGLKKSFGGIFRSYNFSTVAVTSDTFISRNIKLECTNCNPYYVTAKCFRPFEYLKEADFIESFR